MATGISGKRLLEQAACSAPKESKKESMLSALPEEVLAIVFKSLPKQDLESMALVDPDCRRVALREQIVRVMATIPKELVNFSNLDVTHSRLSTSQICAFRRVILEQCRLSPGSVALVELRQAIVDVATQDVAAECLSLRQNLISRIEPLDLIFEDVDQSADRLKKDLFIRALTARINSSANQDATRGCAVRILAEIGDEVTVEALLLNGNISLEDRGFSVGRAAGKGQIEILRVLLRNGATIPPGYMGWAVRAAAETNNQEMIEVLLANGAVISDEDRAEAIKAAVRNGCPNMVKDLLKSGDISDVERGRAIASAAERGHLEIVESLLESGFLFPWDRARALSSAERNGHQEIYELLITRN